MATIKARTQRAMEKAKEMQKAKAIKPAPKRKSTYMELLQEALGIDEKLWITSKGDTEDDQGEEFNVQSNTGRGDCASFTLKQMPGCCGVAVACYFSVNARVWPIVDKLFRQLAWDRGYSLLVCTDRTKNKEHMSAKSLEEWHVCAKFKNRNTSNEIAMFSVPLVDTKVNVGLDNDPEEYNDQGW